MKITKTLILGALCTFSQLSIAAWPDYLTKEEIASLDMFIGKLPKCGLWKQIATEINSKYSTMNVQEFRMFFTKFPSEKLTPNIMRLLKLEGNATLIDQVMQSGLPLDVDSKLCKLLNYPPISEENMRAFAKTHSNREFFESEEVFRMAHHNKQVLINVASGLFGDWFGYQAPEPWKSIWESYLDENPGRIR